MSSFLCFTGTVFRGALLRDKDQACPKGGGWRSSQSTILFHVPLGSHEGHVLFCDETQGMGSKWRGGEVRAAGGPNGSAQWFVLQTGHLQMPPGSPSLLCEQHIRIKGPSSLSSLDSDVTFRTRLAPITLFKMQLPTPPIPLT